ncbi:MAG: hypothetical protein AAB696_02020 [Patescibacteria group bacterium]
MIIVNFTKLNKEEKKLVNKAKLAAKNSVINKNSFVGAVILGAKGGIYKGATIGRTRAIGSTCSERMALDQLYFQGKEEPKIICTIGMFERFGWKNNFICTPCGVCLEMFFESMKFFKISNLKFICSSWDKTKILKCTFEELFPQIGKGQWQRNDSTTL